MNKFVNIISELVLYLLPGFLGLWIFKRIVQEDIDKRSESTQIAIGLMLGISGFFALFLVHSIVNSDYISPKSLRLSDTINFGDNIQFWSSYIALCLLSLLSGVLWGYLSERGMTPVSYLSVQVNKMLRTTIKVPSESALRILVNNLLKECNTDKFLARVYSLGDKENSVIGWIMNYSDTEKELVLSRLELCSAVSDLNEKLNLQPRQCCINYDSGIVIELFDWQAEKMKKFDISIRKKYREKINSLC